MPQTAAEMSSKLTWVVFCSQMKSPGITTSVGGQNKTLYMQTVKSIEERTRQNLQKTLKGIFLEVAPFDLRWHHSHLT